MASAKQIRDEIMRMTIVVNSDPAQQEIYKLTEANRKLTKESADLRQERIKVGQTLGKNSQEYKDLTDKINGNSSSITKNKQEIKELTDTLDVSQMSVKQLKQEAVLLRRELDRVVPGSDQYNALQSQLGAVNTRLAEVRGGARQTSLSFGELSDQFNRYSGIITAGVAILVGFGVSAKAIIDRNNEMADAMTAVEKTTGLARSEVEELARTFSDFDTRTSKVDLFKIAEEGGRLGVAKSEIKDFTQEVDKAYVALGDSWKGTVEDLANSLGKTAKLFAETKDLPIATAINQIGSALNELAASGASSEQNISDFVLRMGRVPEALRPPLNTLLGYGSAFEELGVNAEIGSSGFSKFIRVAAGNVEGFAKVMNQPIEKVRELINTNPAEFFLQFSEGLKGLDGDQIANVLAKLKLADNEVQGAIGAAASNSDLFRESVEKANVAVREGTSITIEFNKVNNNTAAIWEKASKRISELFTSLTFAKYLNSLVAVFAKFIGSMEDADGTVTGFRNGLIFLVKILVLAIATTISYNLVTGVYNGLMLTAYQRVIGLTIVEKARNAVMLLANGIATLYRATLWLLAAGYSLVTGNVVGATFAMRGFTAVLMANPLGAILGLITLVASAYLAFSDSTDDAAKKQKSLNTVMREGTKDATDSIAKLEVLYKTATNVKLSTEERLAAVKKLKAEFPAYFAQISDEIIMNGKASQSYHELRAAIVAAARSKAAQTELEKRAGDQFNETEDWKREYASKYAEVLKYKKALANDESGAIKLAGFAKIEYQNKLVSAEKELKKLADDRLKTRIQQLKNDEKLVDVITKYNDESSKLNPVDAALPKSNYDTSDPEKTSTSKNSTTTTSNNTSAENRHKKEMQDVLKRGEEAVQLARQIELDIEDAKIEAMNEGYFKGLAALKLQEKRKFAEIDKQKIDDAELKKVDEQIDKATGNDKKLFEALKTSWLNNNADLEELKKNQQIIFEQKRKTLQYKSETDFLKDQETNFKKELSQLERQKNEELAKYTSLEELKQGLKGRISEEELKNIKTWSEGKEAVTKVYQQKELDLQVTHLQAMVKLYEGIDLSILTKEQQEQVMSFIEEAGNKIAEFKAKANDVEQGKKGGQEKGAKLGSKGSTDILGMSPEDWDTFFTNIQTGTDALGTAQAAVAALQSAFSTYYSFVQAKEQAQLQQIEKTAKRKEVTLKKQLDTGQLNQEQYEAALQSLNEDTENKKAKLEYEAAKRQRAIQIGQIIANTAQAIMSIWAQVPKFDFGATAGILTGVVGALGALQVATVLKTPLPEAPGYEEGYGMEYDIKRSQDNKQFRVKRKNLTSGLVDRPTHFIAGENGVEMVIDSPTYTGFRPEFKRMLHDEISYSRGYENGYYPEKSSSNSGSNEEKLMMIIEKNTIAMNSIVSKKFTAHVGKTMENAKEFIEMTDEYSTYKNSSKR